MIPQAAVVGRRACALLAACSAVLHGITILHAAESAAAVLMVGMAAACLYCARELWVQGELRTWVLVAIMNIAMIGMHAPFASGHQHGGVAVAAMAMHPSGVMTLATALAAVEAVIATAVVYQRSRHNRVAVAEAASVAAAGGVARNTTRARAQVAVDG
jgi:nicotinamide riboside transporter PnuC